MDDKHRLLKNVDVVFSECNHRSLKGHAKGWNRAFMVVYWIRKSIFDIIWF